MKQTTLIIISIIIVVLLIAVWVYLMFFGTPKDAGQIFADLGLTGEEDPSLIILSEPIIPDEPVVNMDRPRLRQLTTKPVVGFVEVQATTTDPITIRYAEAGTGNIYTIDLSSGTEERLTNTTIKDVSIAHFSPDGQTVALWTSGERRSGGVTIGQIPASPGSLTTSELEKDIYDVTVFSSSSVGFTTKTATGLQATAYSLTTETENPLFTVPFYEATIAWGSSSSATHVVYPKPSYALEGYLYTFTGDTMNRLPASGFGLTAINTPGYIIYTKINSSYTPETWIYNKNKRTMTTAPLTLLPDKCSSHPNNPDILWCANENRKLPFEFPDSWYQGNLAFKDSLWQINLWDASADLFVDTFSESGRELDIVNVSGGVSGTAIYFINKNDNTLWMYEI